MTLLDEHITFIEKNYDVSLHTIPSNIGWVSTDSSITSKIYSSREFVETSIIDDIIVHRVTSF